MKCPFCGYEFDENASPACRNCPFGRSCKLVKCPNCGYETLKEGEGFIAKWLRRLRDGDKQSGPGDTGKDMG
jgi:hypothetical protein